MNNTTSSVGNDPWIQTYSGKKFYPKRPNELEVDITDIAHALAHQCRYAGHCNRFYSVAEHSVLVAQYIEAQVPHDPSLALAALLHDASEYVVVDIPRPVKVVLAGYQEIEAAVMNRIMQTVGTGDPLLWRDPRIKHVDSCILLDERDALMMPTNDADDDWALPGLSRLGVTIWCWQPKEAKQRFLSEYRRIYSRLLRAA